MSDDSMPAADVSQLLQEAAEGDSDAVNQLLPLVYGQLRAMAQRCMNAERPDHTLSATGLVHEAYMKLVGPRQVPWQNQAHFYAAAAESIRRILLDYAKAHRAQKRGGGGKNGVLDVTSLADLTSSEKSDEILALEDAVCRLEAENEIATDPNSRRREFSVRDPDGYYITISEDHNFQG